jgi:hypothetical protein
VKHLYIFRPYRVHKMFWMYCLTFRKYIVFLLVSRAAVILVNESRCQGTFRLVECSLHILVSVSMITQHVTNDDRQINTHGMGIFDVYVAAR